VNLPPLTPPYQGGELKAFSSLSEWGLKAFPSAGGHLQCRPMFIKIIKVKKSKILANKRLGLQNPTSLSVN
jgi:hypothetical protein